MDFNREVISKYLKGKFSLNDKKQVDEYFMGNEYTSDLDGMLKDHWEEVSCGEKPADKNLDFLLDKINHRIRLNTQRPVGRFRMVWRFYSNVAAILILPVLAISLLYSIVSRYDSSAPWVEIHSPYGSRVQFSLPDGSSGWLNGGSVLRYQVQFSKKRVVVLNGEAFFQVVKNPALPFCVDAEGLKIKVLGTSFNVVSYKNDSVTEVTVATGEVEVKGKDVQFMQKLFPSQHLVLDRVKKQVSRSTVDIRNYTSWKNGKLIFLNDNLNEVARKISRYYNVDFEIGVNVNRSQLFRAILEDESLEEVLRYMKLIMPINYTVQEREQNLDGTVTRRKVILTKAVKN